MSDVTVVANPLDIGLATMWRDLLRESGIDAEIVDSGTSTIYPGAPQLGTYRIIVRTEDAERARTIIDEVQLEADDGEAADAAVAAEAETEPAPENDDA